MQPKHLLDVAIHLGYEKDMHKQRQWNEIEM